MTKHLPRRILKISMLTLLGAVLALKADSFLYGLAGMGGTVVVFFLKLIAFFVGSVCLIALLIGPMLRTKHYRLAPLALTVVLCLLHWLPIFPSGVPHAHGFRLRMRRLADIPAIIAWAEQVDVKSSGFSPEDETDRFDRRRTWYRVPRDKLPAPLSRIALIRVLIDPERHVVRSSGRATFSPAFGFVIGRGVARDMPTKSDWYYLRISEDAYVWSQSRP